MKLSIIGKGRGWEHAPYDGISWGITQTLLARQVDAVIDMNIYHDDRWGVEERLEAEEVRKLCEINNIRLVTLENYPIRKIVKKFGTTYFNSSVDYAIALAIHEGYRKIDLWGVNMETDSEYRHQRPGVEYWIGRAHGMGVSVKAMGEHTSLLKTEDGMLYGYGSSYGTK